MSDLFIPLDTEWPGQPVFEDETHELAHRLLPRISAGFVTNPNLPRTWYVSAIGHCAVCGCCFMEPVLFTHLREHSLAELKEAVLKRELGR